jgi:hypothetical protein
VAVWFWEDVAVGIVPVLVPSVVLALEIVVLALCRIPVFTHNRAFCAVALTVGYGLANDQSTDDAKGDVFVASLGHRGR